MYLLVVSHVLHYTIATVLRIRLLSCTAAFTTCGLIATVHVRGTSRLDIMAAHDAILVGYAALEVVRVHTWRDLSGERALACQRPLDEVQVARFLAVILFRAVLERPLDRGQRGTGRAIFWRRCVVDFFVRSCRQAPLLLLRRVVLVQVSAVAIGPLSVVRWRSGLIGGEQR